MDDQSLQDFVESRGKTRLGRILSDTKALFERLRYQPRTQATQAIFDSILTIVAKKCDLPQEDVHSAADCIIQLLKDEVLKDFDTKKEIDDLLGASLNLNEFNELVNLGKKITDYNAEDLGASLNLKEFNELVNLGKEITDYEAEDLLGASLNPKDFIELVNLGTKITDYDAEDKATTTSR